MTRELILKFLDNRCSSAELEEIIRWIGQESLSDQSKDLAYSDWKSFREGEYSSNQDTRFNLILDKIHHKINIKQSVEPEPRLTVIAPRIITWLTKAAAILLIPVLSFLIYTLSENSYRSSRYSDMVVDSLEITAPAGSRTVVQLTDGTEVHLNNGSKIKYPRNFNGKNRELTLSGEGFFDVVHDPKHPFIVKTKQLNIKALGTKFDVEAYPENDWVATTLIEGNVVLEQSTENGKAKKIGSMVPGQHINYNVNTGAILSTKGNIDKYIGWKDGLLVFDNSGIEEVAERLGRMFNVEIKVADEIKDYTYTVKFVDESLPQILDLLTKATPVRYEFFQRVKLPDGTFSKQKIIFEKR